ncbi:alpha/beta hydrolase [Halobacteriales archaeon Cl-PHB]
METKGVTLRAGARDVPAELAVPAESAGVGVLVLPGASHGPYGGVFDEFVATAVARGVHTLRYDSWNDRTDLTDLSMADLRADVDAGLQFLRWGDCDVVAIVAKGFGARVALTRGADYVDRLVLWSPAVLVGEETTGPTIAPDALAPLDVPVRVVHAGADEVVGVGTAADIVRHLPQGDLVELGGEGHLYETASDRVVDRTMAFLADLLPASTRV